MINIVEFEKQARIFLDANAPVRSVADREWGVGSDVLSSYAARSADEESRTVVAAKQWKQLEFDTGFGWITGPAEQGGAGLTAEHERVYQTARNDYDVPPLSLFAISLGMVAPTFAAFAQSKFQVGATPTNCNPTLAHQFTPGGILTLREHVACSR